MWSNDEQSVITEINKLPIFANDNLNLVSTNYARFDAENDNYICEIKKRNFESYHKYAVEGLILEKKKYESLLTKATPGKQALYVNLFTDNKMVIWNLTQLTNEGHDFSWFNKKMNRATFKSVNNKTDKEVSLLKIETSIDNNAKV
tara:strand:+ start:88 stop:525 length:438 start_codon:yes stop_codon:yes gene_type:complete